MEIAHDQTRVLRVIGKFVLLGFLVALLAKVILRLLVLAVVGLLACVVARALYNRRAQFKQFLCWTKEKLIHSGSMILPFGTAATGAARRIPCMLLGFAAILKALLALIGTLLLVAAKIGWVIFWKSVRELQTVITFALKIAFRQGQRIAAALLPVPGRTCTAVARTASAAVTGIRSQSSVICGTFIEAASGAILGGMLAVILVGSFSTGRAFEASPMPVVICGAALFGAFLGITVGLSRITRAKQGEPNQLPENQN